MDETMIDTITPPKYFNEKDPITFLSKIGAFAYAFLIGKLSSSAPSLASESNTPPVDPNVVKLEKCEEEFDNTQREAKFALRTRDLSSLYSTPSCAECGSITNSDPTTIQHWAVVVHFPSKIKSKTYVFQAWGDEGLLQAFRAENVNKEVFEKATYFDTVETTPRELLEKAKQVSTGRYDALSNNCQTWTREFLYLTSPKLLTSLNDKIPATETYWGYLRRKLNSLSPPQ